VLKVLKNRITAASVTDSFGPRFLKDKLFQKIFFFTLLILIWQAICYMEIYPRYLLPRPLDIVKSLVFGFTKAHYGIAIFESLKRVIFSYIIAVLFGLLSGLIIARYKFFDNTLGASLTALQSIPSIAWVPLALLWFGISEAAVIFIVILEAFIPCTLGVRTGVLTIPKEIIRAAQCLGAKRLDLYTRVIFPAILPQLLSSLRLSWAFAWRALIAGELFVTGLGIGQKLELARSLADMSQVISMMLIIAIFAYITDNLFFTNIENKIKESWGL
jgi:NitT/TauT family transport system permease protein